MGGRDRLLGDPPHTSGLNGATSRARPDESIASSATQPFAGAETFAALSRRIRSENGTRCRHTFAAHKPCYRGDIVSLESLANQRIGSSA